MLELGAGGEGAGFNGGGKSIEVMGDVVVLMGMLTVSWV